MTSDRDPHFLPGAVKYGDLPALLALNAPHTLRMDGEAGVLPAVVKAAYASADAEAHVEASPLQSSAEAAATWLLDSAN